MSSPEDSCGVIDAIVPRESEGYSSLIFQVDEEPTSLTPWIDSIFLLSLGGGMVYLG